MMYVVIPPPPLSLVRDGYCGAEGEAAGRSGTAKQGLTTYFCTQTVSKRGSWSGKSWNPWIAFAVRSWAAWKL